jgi:hypothetical protein
VGRARRAKNKNRPQREQIESAAAARIAQTGMKEVLHHGFALRVIRNRVRGPEEFAKPKMEMPQYKY